MPENIEGTALGYQDKNGPYFKIFTQGEVHRYFPSGSPSNTPPAEDVERVHVTGSRMSESEALEHDYGLDLPSIHPERAVISRMVAPYARAIFAAEMAYGPPQLKGIAAGTLAAAGALWTASQFTADPQATSQGLNINPIQLRFGLGFF